MELDFRSHIAFPFWYDILSNVCSSLSWVEIFKPQPKKKKFCRTYFYYFVSINRHGCNDWRMNPFRWSWSVPKIIFRMKRKALLKASFCYLILTHRCLIYWDMLHALSYFSGEFILALWELCRAVKMKMPWAEPNSVWLINFMSLICP